MSDITDISTYRAEKNANRSTSHVERLRAQLKDAPAEFRPLLRQMLREAEEMAAAQRGPRPA